MCFPPLIQNKLTNLKWMDIKMTRHTVILSASSTKVIIIALFLSLRNNKNKHPLYLNFFTDFSIRQWKCLMPQKLSPSTLFFSLQAPLLQVGPLQSCLCLYRGILQPYHFISRLTHLIANTVFEKYRLSFYGCTGKTRAGMEAKDSSKTAI